MKNKDVSLLQAFILTCSIIVVPSQPLLSSHPAKTIPKTTEPKKQVIQLAINEDEEINKKDEDEEEITEQPQLDTTIAASTKETQIATPTPGLLTRIYIAAAPIILVTLNKALGTGIGAATKSFIKQVMERQAFMTLKSDILLGIDQTFHPEDLQTMSEQDKLNLTKETLREFKIDFDQKEKQTSFPSIISQAIYIGTLNTLVPMVGSLMGFGATMLLQQLMPTE